MAIGLKLRNLLFVIHAVPPERVAHLLPAGIELDLRETPEGPRAFVTTVTVEAGAAFPYVLTGFRQVNYRIYVRHNDEPGVVFLRSWVSSRGAAAAMSLAIATEHASVDIAIDDRPKPYSRYAVEARSGDHHLEVEAHADESISFAPFASREEAVKFFTHRLNGFAAGEHPKGLSVIRVSHPPMNPLPARVLSMRADQWTGAGILMPQEVQHPLLALIQPEIQFDMNLPERIG